VILPPSAPTQVATGSPTDGKIGAFEAPKVEAAAAGRSPAKPQTDHVAVDLGTGKTSRNTQPVRIPDVQWKPPVTAVEAKPAAKGGERAVVTRKDGTDINCRIDTIDAPETAKPKYGKAGQPYAEEARRTLQQMVENKEVTIRVTKPAEQGKYGRALCQIEVEGRNVDKEMLKAGAAWLYRRYNKDLELIELENAARSGKRGLWADPNPVNPERFRRMQEFGK
jgi:micrococcal nuclease